ncbi:hypothetical protein [Pseudomonas auratipiscis]|uniref:Helix-turn-helix domain-containing protein n=1 Tax=Pseudomonas auratipiscis TaxID=3115853 RepID=A0AB35WR35_9PSED|nr:MULTISPECIES: hypothetical protein [unclassified Pseudomonas]MEE1866902.1 hypothetical protein [Pseudomonas sp. 120P]MEE1960600.1 hypothetical protein [Pseudomonas sp. 119P]
MIGDPIPSPRDQVLADLNARIDSFFASGRQPEQLDGPTFAPRPIRPIAAGAMAEDDGPPKPGSRTEINLVRELAKTHTFTEAVEASGIKRPRLLQLSKAHMITFLVSSTERRARAVAKKQREDQKAEHCKQIRALAGTGITRNQVAQQLGISYCLLARLISDHSIDFPLRGKLK